MGFAMKKFPFDKFKRKPYPLDQFPWLARETGLSVHEQTQLSDALIGMLMISVMTIVCQGLIDVRLPTGRISPVVQFLLMVFESGSGKTFLRNLFFEPFENSALQAKIKFDSLMEQYDVDIELWNVDHKEFKRGISTANRKGESTSELKTLLAEHIQKKPKKPKLRNSLRCDITITAIMEAIEGNGESIAHLFDEGEAAFKGDVMLNPGVMSRFWDAQEFITRDRGNRSQIVAMNSRVSNHILTQYAPLKTFLDKSGNLAKESGHMARYLIGGDCSKKGYRTVHKEEMDRGWLSKFNYRTSALLNLFLTMIESGKVKREILEFTDDAKARWFEIAQYNETKLREGEYLSDINDFASKMMDIIARLAATMHYFSGESGKITRDTLERAYNIVQWHLAEYKYLFSSDFMVSQVEIDAYAEARWLRMKKWKGPGSDIFVTKSTVLNGGATRCSKRTHPALDLLVEQGAIEYAWISGPKGGTECIRLMNDYFANFEL